MWIGRTWTLRNHITRDQELACQAAADARWLVEYGEGDEHALALVCSLQREAATHAAIARRYLAMLLDEVKP